VRNGAALRVLVSHFPGRKSETGFGVMIGVRLTKVRGKISQGAMAEQLGVHKNTYARWERGEAEIGANALQCLVEDGWNANWLLTGDGPERLDSLQTATQSQSQGMRPEELTLSVQLAQEALDGDTLDPPDYAQLVSLIYDALVNGLPSAQVIAFARPAARGLSNRGPKDGKSTVGGTGQGTAGQG
jgi:transcriptional regulator with XRE-family HTH domain